MLNYYTAGIKEFNISYNKLQKLNQSIPTLSLYNLYANMQLRVIYKEFNINSMFYNLT